MGKLRSWIMGRDTTQQPDKQDRDNREDRTTDKQTSRRKKKQIARLIKQLRQLRESSKKLAAKNERSRQKAHETLGKVIFTELAHYEITDEIEEDGKKKKKVLTQEDVPNMTVEQLINILELILHDYEEKYGR